MVYTMTDYVALQTRVEYSPLTSLKLSPIIPFHVCADKEKRVDEIEQAQARPIQGLSNV